ncbi:MAG: hypothetical protein JW863_15625 [Chitinispirillaceae bacterium]|nr:hypothetical protein [Chitinispirillaceae bacterium]
MSSTEYYKDTLTQLAPVFSRAAVECVDAFFGKKSDLHLPWEVVDQLQSKFDLILTIGSSNEHHSALMYAGIQYESLAAFTDSEAIPTEAAADILGEFVNTYSGMIADHEEFTEKFGILTQALPVLYTDGQSYLPFIWGIQGYVYINRHWIYVGYTIRKNLKDQSNPA